MKVMFLKRPEKHLFSHTIFEKMWLQASFHARFIKLSQESCIFYQKTLMMIVDALGCNLQAVIETSACHETPKKIWKQLHVTKSEVADSFWPVP